ncbi:ABC-F family ATP-binding cassette domain-containing protein [Adlercreutzia aquisgranensis]|uniref:ABC-F family ATP-binding cassette domain-containing protein n=1 Tax=Adlercreutzia aquisgranensis TaxID=2941323 RepID=UPI00203B6D46|nr:ABC-F family ATP-binding cassette domain-containing protein [Adlercreutzia aquisgranensis]
MAFVLGCEKLSVEFPTRQVLAEVSLGVNDGDRIGIVGRNGDGKSTLLSALAGVLEPTGGRVLRKGGTTVGLLGQSDGLRDDDSVGRAIVGDAPEYEWAGSARIRDILDGLVSDIPWDAPVGTLSGGQRRRVDLARLLVGEWDVLALDEPTNHLDVRAITWLANHLKGRWRAGQGVLLVVTHDRWFLDEVCTGMWEVHDGRVEPFEGGFSAYILQRVERDRLAALAEQKRQNAVRRELAWLSRGARARSTKPKFHVKAAQALIADVPPLRNELELKRMAMARLGKQVVDLESVTVRFPPRGEGAPAKTVLDGVEWIIGPGDRYGIVGDNGAGKTTLLKVIEGALAPTAGRVKIGKTVRFAVLSQHLDSLSQFGDDRVRQVIGRYSRRVMLDGKEQTPAQLLERLGFSKADLNEPVCDLSGGQKRRLALMLILLDEPNVLVLDEPGNDLDTDMLAAVEDLLDAWPGTLLLVTHDRYLMERVTDHQFALVNGKIVHLPGGVQDYLDMTAEPGAAQTGAGVKGAPAASKAARSATGAAAAGSQAAGDGAGGDGETKLSGGEIRALRKAMQSAERKMETLRGKIEAAQQAMLSVDPTDFQALGSKQAEIDELQEKLEELEAEWLEAAEALGE